MENKYITQAKSIHDSKYSYIDLPSTMNLNTTISIICPEHGLFRKRLSRHINEQQGCPTCQKEKARLTSLKAYTEELTQLLPSGFTFTVVEFCSKRDSKLEITCPKHGKFTSSFANALVSKYVCSKCGIESAAASKTKDTKWFIESAQEVHGNLYDYSKVVYTAAKDKVTIICPVHGEFKQLASGHLSGYGCLKCRNNGKGRVDMNKPCLLYYFRIAGTELYKIGITTRSIEERYRTSFDRNQIEIVFTKQFQTGREAYEMEQTLIQQNKTKLYTGSKLLKSGNSEIFTSDIFCGNYPEEA